MHFAAHYPVHCEGLGAEPVAQSEVDNVPWRVNFDDIAAEVAAKHLAKPIVETELLTTLQPGVVPQAETYRLFAEDGSTIIVKIHMRQVWEEELRNLHLIQEIAPEHGVDAAGDGEGALFLRDFGDLTLARAGSRDPRNAMVYWRAWAEAVATIHARSLEQSPGWKRSGRTAYPLKPERLAAILDRAATELGCETADGDELLSSLDDLVKRLRSILRQRKVLGFADPNPANVLLGDGNVRFIDVGGPAFGLMSRALGEVWRSPEPTAVVGYYLEALHARGVTLNGNELQDERELFEISSSLEWTERHLKALPRGGIKDVDGSQGDPMAAVRSNLDTLRRLSATRGWLRPVEAVTVRLLER